MKREGNAAAASVQGCCCCSERGDEGCHWCLPPLLDGLPLPLLRTCAPSCSYDVAATSSAGVAALQLSPLPLLSLAAALGRRLLGEALLQRKKGARGPAGQ